MVATMLRSFEPSTRPVEQGKQPAGEVIIVESRPTPHAAR